MHQGGGLKGLTGLLLSQFVGRQLAKLVVDQRQQLRGGVRVAVLDGRQDARDIGHGCGTWGRDDTSQGVAAGLAS